ncbi:MAG: transglutaminase domain-containing protein [Clostridia bacterium]|nr:transglutaminase domain-containing protein [Clostridia bacterium]
MTMGNISMKMQADKIQSRDRKAIAVVGALLALALSSAVVQYTDLDPWMIYSYMRIFMTVVIAMPVCMIIFANRRSMLVSASTIAVAAAIITVIWLAGGFSETILNGISSYLQWVGGFVFDWQIGMDITHDQVYATTVIISVLITIAMYFLVVRRLVYAPVLIMTVSLFTAQWIVAREVNKFAFYLSLMMLVILYFLQVYNRKLGEIRKRSESVNLMRPGQFIISAVPVMLVVILITMMIPKSIDPILWKWLDEKIKYRDFYADKPIDFSSYDYFSLAVTGFSSEPGKPGGSLLLDYAHVLDVRSDRAAYIRGESWPYFDGSSWGGASVFENYAEDILSYRAYDAGSRMLLEPVYGWRFMDINRWLAEEFQKYEGVTILPGPDFNQVPGIHLLPGWYESGGMEISYVGLETKTMFSPLYSVLRDYDEIPSIFAEMDDTLESGIKIKLDTTLDYDYLMLDRNNSDFLEYIRRSRKGLYEETYSALYYLSNNSAAYENIGIANSMEEALGDLRELYLAARDYYWRYTPVPADLPERVVRLAMEITEGHDNAYDKVRALEAYFNEGFEYSLEVPDVPEGRNFVDWFVFDSPKGYCTYYATAMVTMVRSLGIPARYVEGFLIPSVPESGGAYKVLNSNAHAWVEVYFEGIGWVGFEPTPPYTELLEENKPPDPLDGGGIFDDIDMDENLDEPGQDDNGGAYVPFGGGKKISKEQRAVIIAAMALALLLALNTIIAVARNLFFRNIRGTKRFRLGYRMVLGIVSFRGFRIRKGMTLLELAARIDGAYFMAHYSMKDMTGIYYRILYDDAPVPLDELRKMEVFYREFRKEFNNELRLWEWIVFRFIIPRV